MRQNTNRHSLRPLYIAGFAALLTWSLAATGDRLWAQGPAVEKPSSEERIPVLARSDMLLIWQMDSQDIFETMWQTEQFQQIPPETHRALTQLGQGTRANVHAALAEGIPAASLEFAINVYMRVDVILGKNETLLPSFEGTMRRLRGKVEFTDEQRALRERWTRQIAESEKPTQCQLGVELAEFALEQAKLKNSSEAVWKSVMDKAAMDGRLDLLALRISTDISNPSVTDSYIDGFRPESGEAKTNGSVSIEDGKASISKMGGDSSGIPAVRLTAKQTVEGRTIAIEFVVRTDRSGPCASADDAQSSVSNGKSTMTRPSFVFNTVAVAMTAVAAGWSRAAGTLLAPFVSADVDPL